MTNLNLPSIPFNLTITERKKGKTVILSWDSVYNKNKPTMFVIEGRSSIRAPYSMSSEDSDGDSKMSQWSYLASTVNTNWVILRSINRGRWYKFRVGSVSKSGSFGYSQPTELFRLSSPPKPPTQPMNLSVSRVYESADMPVAVNVDVAWLGSKRSDLPIVEYKLTWRLQKQENVPVDDFDTSSEPQKNSNKNGFEIINPEQLLNGNKFTIRNLLKNSIYTLQICAVSIYEDKRLTSSPATTRLDTANITPVASSLLIANDPFMIHSTPSGLNEDEEEDYDIEDEIAPAAQTEPPSLNKQAIRNSNPDINTEPDTELVTSENDDTESSVTKPPTANIYNITVQTPYFQNGLVKAKLSWQIETSIVAKSSDRPTMYTLTWFPIKCHHNQKMPIPITASTIHTHFEIYELRYNCDYVINVRVARDSSILVGLPGSSTVLPPQQIVSSQFRVPSCSSIGIVGRLRPICYDTPNVATAKSIEPTASNKYQKSFVNLLYSSSTPPTTTTESSTPVPTQPPTTTTPNLPRVLKIKYKLIDKIRNLYSVEFGWSLPHGFNRDLFSGYQISVVPKETPSGVASAQQLNSNGAYFGSVGAIVSKEQRTFVVRQLMSAVRYVFQIQSIGLDGQSYGPTSSLEFIIEDKSSVSNGRIGNGLNNRHRYGGRHDYEVINIDQNDVRTSGESDDYSLLFMTSTSTAASGGSSSLLTDNSETSGCDLLLSNNKWTLVLVLLAVVFNLVLN
jgi:hypothetical protein